MSKIQKLSFVTSMMIVLTGCNEKVSPELLQGNATVPATTTTAPTEYSFSIENTSSPLLNYKVHKTGEGNHSADCKVSSTTAFSEDSFGSSSNDISCFFEAEELSLYLGGFNFALKASKNTCDFIGYQPFGFYDRIPGDSSGNYLEIDCSNDTTTSVHARTAATALGYSTTTASGANTLACNNLLSRDIADGTREPFSIVTDEELCRFNYSDGNNEKCDIGIINIDKITVTYTPATADAAAELKYEVAQRVVRCGGAVANCVQGPTKSIKTNVTRIVDITKPNSGEEINLNYSYASPFSQGHLTNRFYANYRRSLANRYINFGDSQPLTDNELDNYRDLWSDTDNGKTFEPELMDYFSNNIMFDNSNPIVTNDIINDEAIRNNKWKAKPLAADPYLGLSGVVNPFYTFYCFDNALEIKARIRMIVREWDRVFPSATSDLEYLSDLFRNSNARQDIDGDQIANSNDPTIPLNDLNDWDDFIPMSRTVEDFDPQTTIWRPTPDATYTEGWFNPANFTNNFY